MILICWVWNMYIYATTCWGFELLKDLKCQFPLQSIRKTSRILKSSWSETYGTLYPSPASIGRAAGAISHLSSTMRLPQVRWSHHWFLNGKQFSSPPAAPKQKDGCVNHRILPAVVLLMKIKRRKAIEISWSFWSFWKRLKTMSCLAVALTCWNVPGSLVPAICETPIELPQLSSGLTKLASLQCMDSLSWVQDRERA